MVLTSLPDELHNDTTAHCKDILDSIRHELKRHDKKGPIVSILERVRKEALAIYESAATLKHVENKPEAPSPDGSNLEREFLHRARVHSTRQLQAARDWLARVEIPERRGT